MGLTAMLLFTSLFGVGLTGIGIFILTVVLPLCVGVGITALGWTTYTHNIDLQKENAPQIQQ
ncbi:MAG: hypothetical protein ACSHX7_00765 [Luteolibacter sp.]